MSLSDDRIASLTKQVQALQLQVTGLQEELKQHNRSQQTPPSTSTVINTLIQLGDRIRITNTVKKPLSWDNAIEFNQQQAKLATVTAVVNNRIYFTTDNGIHTWRSRRNIIQHK
jgi:hypothetical protein